MNGETLIYDWLIPVVVTIIILFGLGVIFFYTFKGIKHYFYSKSFYDFKYKFLYNIFKRKVNQDVIQWCVDAKNKDLDDDNVRKRMLIKGGYNNHTIEEVVYLYKMVNPPKKMDTNIKYKDLPELKDKKKDIKK